MLLMLYRIGINKFFNISIAVFDDFDYTLFIRPFDEVLCKARISFPCSAQKNNSEIVFPTSGPGSGRTVMHADTAAHTLLCISLNFAIDHGQGSYRTPFTHIHTLLAGHAAVRIVLRFRHADNTIVIHSHLGTIVRTPGESHLHMTIIGKNLMIDSQRKRLGIIIPERTEFSTGTGHNISGARRIEARFLFSLYDLIMIDNRLNLLFYRFHVFQTNLRNFNSLPVGNIDRAISISIGNINDLL